MANKWLSRDSSPGLSDYVCSQISSPLLRQEEPELGVR